jgi:hypothetical protein
MTIYSKNTGRSLPKTLTMFQGGLFIGAFYPGPPITNTSSDLYGNKNTGAPRLYKTFSDGEGTKSGSWGIIISPVDYIPSSYANFYNKNEQFLKQSSYDGLYNVDTQLKFYFNMRRNFKYGGYTDWYIPSVDELAFISNNLPIGYYISRDFNAFQSNVYRSSTISLQTTVPFFFAQSFSKDTYGTVVNVNGESGDTGIRPIRRIEIL